MKIDRGKISYRDIENIRLGATYKKDKTVFRVFAPDRLSVDLLITDNYKKVRKEKYRMEKDDLGVFSACVNKDLDGYFYSYLVDNQYEVTDPYCYSASINSLYSAIVDMEKTDPKGFRNSKNPNIKENESIIYEMSVKNYTIDKSSGVFNRGKYLGLCEKDTSYKSFSTGISHIKDLGVSHVQLMPIYDFISVNEDGARFFDDDNYNWGYDPELYFSPEGSYASDPFDPKSRVIDLKKMVKSFHDEGIGVVMDVVYNHTFKTIDSNLNTLAPKYYYRLDSNGSFSNGSGCGNELASERPFVRKLIIDSLLHWAKEYKVDGFRFDLMALIDLDTVNILTKKLKSINPNILIYGEPWMASNSALDYDKQVIKGRQRSKGFALFNDGFRDAIKGDVNSFGRGYIQGEYWLKKDIELGISGSTEDNRGFTDNASETINYFNCHDNLTLYDKLKMSLDDTNQIDSYVKIALAIIMLSFGKAFIYEGNEFNHSKNNDINSYKSPPSINAINWAFKEENFELFTYTRDLISLRKNIKSFTLTKKSDISMRLTFIKNIPDSIIAYIIKESIYSYLIIINAGSNEFKLAKDILEEYLDLSRVNSIKCVFNKKGKENLKVNIESYIKVPGISVNVYKIGE